MGANLLYMYTNQGLLSSSKGIENNKTKSNKDLASRENMNDQRSNISVLSFLLMAYKPRVLA